jgi:hypothetical protein
MNIENDIGPRDDQVFIAAFEVRPAEILCRQVMRLDGRARRAIKHENALGQ